MTTRKSAGGGDLDAVETCRWRTGDRRCAIPMTPYCSFHSHWMRLVDHRVLDRQQQEEFFDWWEQFQPYGRYGNNPGIWWADRDVLWAALTGVGAVPVTDESIKMELYLRRVEVRNFLRNEARVINNSWDRKMGLPLPAWDADRWKEKAVLWDELREAEQMRARAQGAA